MYELLAKKGELDAEKAKLVQQFESAWEIYARGNLPRPRRRSRRVSRSWTMSQAASTRPNASSSLRIHRRKDGQAVDPVDSKSHSRIE